MRTRTLLATALMAVTLVLPLQGAAATPGAATAAPAVTTDCDGIDIASVPLVAGAPIGRTPCPGVRPGALVRSELGSCTFNFLFRGSDGWRYIGTAGHCILEEDGMSTWRRGKGPAAGDSTGERFGEFSYAVLGSDQDFALIRIDRGVKVDPGMCHWGGPTRGDRGDPAEGTFLRHFGQGVAIGALPVGNTPVVPARTARLRTATPDNIYADGAAIFGDSGSAVIEEDGTARGVLVNLQLVPSRGLIGVTRLRPQLADARKVTGVRYRLRTAPLEQ